MPFLEWTRDGAAGGRIELRDGADIRIGRGADAEGRVEGDPYLSRLHVQAALRGGRLDVRRLPSGANPVYHAGVDKAEFRLGPGECFVIGSTRFRFVVEAAACAPTRLEAEPAVQRVMEPAEIYAASDRMKLKDLLELPEILRSKERSDFHFHIAGMLRLAVGAQWAAVLSDKLEVLGRDAARDDVKVGISSKLCARAMETAPLPVFHSWRRPDDGLQATVFEGADWAACAAAELPGGEKLLFYAAGAGGSPSATDQANLDTARYVGLIADVVGRSFSVKRLEEWEARLERFFPRRVVDHLLAEGDLRELEPKLAESTLLFFDIRGFSRMAEGVDERILEFQRSLHRIMTEMTDEILKEEGVVLQYLGDGILACWNVPRAEEDHVDRACRAALGMQARLTKMNPAMRCGIGLHTGRVVAGTIGSDQIFAYGVVGSVINQASRVEGITKLVGAPILATKEVAGKLSAASGVAATPLGFFRPAGMAAALELCELSPAPADPARAAAFEAAALALREGRWADVSKALSPRPADDAPARWMAGFAEKSALAPPADWRGVVELSAK